MHATYGCEFSAKSNVRTRFDLCSDNKPTTQNSNLKAWQAWKRTILDAYGVYLLCMKTAKQKNGYVFHVPNMHANVCCIVLVPNAVKI